MNPSDLSLVSAAYGISLVREILGEVWGSLDAIGREEDVAIVSDMRKKAIDMEDRLWEIIYEQTEESA